jgi:hypothetical protein
VQQGFRALHCFFTLGFFVDETDDKEMARFRKAMVIVAAGLFLYGVSCLWQSPRVRDEATRVPRMTCEHFLQNGPGTNRYIALTDACLNIAGQSISEQDSDNGTLELYHPLYAAHLPQEPRPRDLTLILGIMDETERRRVRDDCNQRKQLGQPGLSELTGEVSRGADLPQWVTQRFTEKYPGISLEKCWVITVGRYEPTASRASQLLWHGIGSTTTAGVLILAWWFWRRLESRPGEVKVQSPIHR